jgi:2,4-dienoyl-CoA reductase-like NADH-dependent reductase (Old Yellow Enzyme family)
LKEWVKAIHDHGSKAAAQLATYGYWSKKGREGTAEDVGPSAVVLPREGIHPGTYYAWLKDFMEAGKNAWFGTIFAMPPALRYRILSERMPA